MKLLYIGVHSHKGWGAEYWLEKSFTYLKIELELINYREIRKKSGIEKLKEIITEKCSTCDIVFLQRGERINPSLFRDVQIPIVFWSTEPIQLKNDGDELLSSDIFSWVYVHSYSCMDRIEDEFPHIKNKTTVMHNAAPKEIIQTGVQKSRLAIFNRNLSWRRKWWLFPSRKLYEGVNGRYGDDYFKDLRESQISINIHYSNKNLDDFESGIFEAMASGCAVVSERLHPQTLIDLGLEGSIIQIDNPKELKQKLLELKQNHKMVEDYQLKSIQVIQQNTWENRAILFINKFKEICSENK